MNIIGYLKTEWARADKVTKGLLVVGSLGLATTLPLLPQALEDLHSAPRSSAVQTAAIPSQKPY